MLFRIAIMILLAILAGCDKPGHSTGETSETLMRVQFDWAPEPEFGGFYAAELKDEFKKRQLRVELHPGTAGTPVVQMVASGQIELGVSGADDLLIALDHGMDLVPVYASFQDSPLGLMLHLEREFSDPSELVQKGTLAMIPGSTPLRYLERKYPFQGVRLVPTGNNLSSFMSDPLFIQQCFITSEPVEAEAKGAKVRVLLFKDLGYNPYTGVVFTRRQFLKEHPDEIARFTEALKSGWHLYQSDPEPAILAMHQKNPTLSLSTFRKATQIQEAYLFGSSKDQAGEMTENRWMDLAITLKELGLIQNLPKLPFLPSKAP